MKVEEISIPDILSISGDLFIIIDTTGKVLFHNANDNRLEYLTRKPIRKGELLKNIVREGAESFVPEIINEVIQTGRSYKMESEYQNSKNRSVFISATYSPVFINNCVNQIYILVQDITTQKIYEHKLSTQAQNTAKLVEQANAIIIGVDTRGYITDWNAHAAAITGFTKNDAYAQKFENLLLPDSEKTAFQNLLRTLLDSEQVRNHEIVLLRKNGSQLTTLLSGTPRTTTAGDMIGAFFVGQDVTELMEYRRSLEYKVEERTAELMRALKKEREVVEMKNRFVSIASHEFRTPLSFIRASADFIRDNLNPANMQALHMKLDDIRHQVSHMTELLDDVLTYGKGEAGKIQLITAPVELTKFLNAMAEEVSCSTNHTHLIELEYRNLPSVVVTDEKLFRNIVINLLSNAIKFSPGRSSVQLRVQYSLNSLNIIIQDAGIGIPPEELNKIFEPFIRGKSVATIDGTGLGLSIVKKAVELLDGSIRVSSDVGRGTVFTVILPDQFR